MDNFLFWKMMTSHDYQGLYTNIPFLLRTVKFSVLYIERWHQTALLRTQAFGKGKPKRNWQVHNSHTAAYIY